MLAAKHLRTGGFPADERTARTTNVLVSGGTFADWGPSGHTRANPYVSIDVTWVLPTVADHGRRSGSPRAVQPSSIIHQ